MRHTRRLLSFLLFGASLFAQGTPSLTFTQSFTAASVGAFVSNGPTVQGGPQGSVGFRMVYYIQPGSGAVSAMSIELDGASTSGGTYTALTPAVGGGSGGASTTNPVTTAPPGQNNTCCDYWPFLRITLNTFTVSSGAPILIVKVFGYAGTTAAVNSGTNAPTGAAGGNLAGFYPNPEVIAVNNGAIPPGSICVGTNALSQFIPEACGNSLVYYFQNSIVSSGTYVSGGALAGTGTCTLTAFNGGGTGATASVPITGGVITGGAALTITAAGTQYTSAPTTATLGNGTGTGVCSGTATITTVMNQPASDISGDQQALAAVYSPLTTMAYPIASGVGTTNEQSWATTPNQPALAFIPAGSYFCTLRASRTNGFTGTGSLQCVFQEVNAAGAFIATIGTTNASPNLGLVDTLYALEFDNPAIYTMASVSSRIVTVVQLVSNVGVIGTLNLTVGGTATPHIQLPAAQTQYNVNGVPFCTGFTPTNGQFLQFTTALTPNPCYTAGNGVTHSVGVLPAGRPVIGNGGGDVQVGTKTSTDNVTRFATAEAFGAGSGFQPALWDAQGDLYQGAAGLLLPGGGTTGQVLTKNSNADFDTGWTFPGVWTYGAATGAGDLFLLTDTASNTGTGFIQHITTASGSAASPWKADANGVGCSINSAGLFNCTPGSGIASGEATLMNFGPQGVVTTQFVGNTFQSSGIGAGRFTNDTGFPSVTFGKSRAATIGTQTVVQNGDGLGGIIFAGSDGTNFIKAAEILVQALGSISTGIVPGSMVFQTANPSGVNTTAGSISPTQVWSLVGPLNALHIAGNGASPTVAAGGAIATTPTISGTDFFGTVSIPSSAVTTGTIATVTFGTAYGVAPKCMVTQNGGIVSIGVGHGTPGTGTFTITAAIANVSATTYSFDYACSGN